MCVCARAHVHAFVCERACVCKYTAIKKRGIQRKILFIVE